MNQPQQLEKAPPPGRNWKRPELRLSLAMRIALERARQAQPPIRSMAANVANPWRRTE